MYFFFFKQKTAYEMRISDWSSDVCSSDLETPGLVGRDGCEENNRDAARALGAAHEFREFEAIHLRHLNVDQGQREVVDTQELQSHPPSSRLEALKHIPTLQRPQPRKIPSDTIHEPNFNFHRAGSAQAPLQFAV